MASPGKGGTAGGSKGGSRPSKFQANKQKQIDLFGRVSFDLKRRNTQYNVARPIQNLRDMYAIRNNLT